MKKFLVLSLSLTVFCPFAASETIYMQKQTTITPTSVQTNETTYSVEQSGGKVYKIRANNTDSQTNVSKEPPIDDETGIELWNKNSDKYNNIDKSSKFKNKVKNTFGKNQDYITAPSGSEAVYSSSIQRLLAKINDPYVVKINKTKYYIVKNADDKNYTLNNILGYGDNKTSLFSSLKSLDTDTDNKITKEELKKAQIRFVALNNGKLQLNTPESDFNDILYIDLGNIRESVNTNNMIGSFGYFDVYITDKNGSTKKIIGYVSFDSDEELIEMIK